VSDLLTETGANFSPCRTWRYRLWRRWSDARPITMLMLNPSTADEEDNDPTVERCERRARACGYGGLTVLNIFAFCATDPKVMKAAPDPIGPSNDDAIRAVLAGVARARLEGFSAPLICAGWGAHGSHRGRDRQIANMAINAGADLHCLAVTKSGQPGHPLYLRNDAQFQPWSAP